ncbi:hypothetical protein [Leifsonia aquatica]|uniref:hypothetical protein n=1 Tax=Leifsonia aquatica TaxID=144185 RepID=UPI0013B3E151|nr:hypothetical protein [Leifsonia aquatica]
MSKLTRSTRNVVIAAMATLALSVGLAGCSAASGQQAKPASGGTSCLNLRSTITNLKALSAWSLNHQDAKGAASWISGIEGALKSEFSGGAAASQVQSAISRLDEQMKLLTGPNHSDAVAQLPNTVGQIVDGLTPARDAVCG